MPHPAVGRNYPFLNPAQRGQWLMYKVRCRSSSGSVEENAGNCGANSQHRGTRLGIPLVYILEAATVKYSVRYRTAPHRKDDAAERRAVKRYLRHVAGIPLPG